jgi:chromosome segregation ATPase
MAGKKSVIETGVDKLVKLIAERTKISVKDAAKELGVSVSSIEEWADFLEEEGIISIQAHFATVYLVEKSISKKDVIEKVKAVREEKDAFVRRVESSINALQRDGEEIKLVDSEFRQIRSMLEEKFSKLGKKLDMLEDFRKSHQEMGQRCEQLEKSYDDKLNQLEFRLKKQEKAYHDTLADVEKELIQIKDERGKVTQMKVAEEDLHSKVVQINTMIEHVRKEIEKENEQLDIDEKRLNKSEELANSIKKEIESTSKELEAVSKQFVVSRRELEGMEKMFLKDVDSLKKGEFEKIGSYRESMQLTDKLKRFFAQANNVEDLIKKAEKEETELKEHFMKLGKKVQAFSAVTSAPEIKEEMASLHDELVEIESRKRLLGEQLKKLRSFVRSAMT